MQPPLCFAQGPTAAGTAPARLVQQYSAHTTTLGKDMDLQAPGPVDPRLARVARRHWRHATGRMYGTVDGQVDDYYKST